MRRDDIFYYALYAFAHAHAHALGRDADATEYWNLLVSSVRRYGARPTLTAVSVIVYIGPHSCVQSERPVRQLRNSVWKRRFYFCVSADPIPSSYRLFFPPHTSLPPSVRTTLSLIHRRISIVFHSHVQPLTFVPTTVSQALFYVVIFRLVLILRS